VGGLNLRAMMWLYYLLLPLVHLIRNDFIRIERGDVVDPDLCGTNIQTSPLYNNGECI